MVKLKGRKEKCSDIQIGICVTMMMMIIMMIMMMILVVINSMILT